MDRAEVALTPSAIASLPRPERIEPKRGVGDLELVEGTCSGAHPDRAEAAHEDQQKRSLAPFALAVEQLDELDTFHTDALKRPRAIERYDGRSHDRRE